MTEHTHVLDLAGVCTGPGPCVTTPTGTGNNWVTRAGGLPDYVRALVNAFKRKGVPETIAVQHAIGVLQNWASGRGNVTAETRARAAKAIAEWEALKAKAHSLTAAPTMTIDLADSVVATTDGPNLTYPVETQIIKQRAATATFPHKFTPAKWTHPNGHPRCAKCGQEERTGGMCTKPEEKPTAGPATAIPLTAPPAATVDLTARFRHGWLRINAADPTAVERATRVASTDGHVLLHGDGMVPAAQQVMERMRTAGHMPSVHRMDLNGTMHVHIARRRG